MMTGMFLPSPGLRLKLAEAWLRLAAVTLTRMLSIVLAPLFITQYCRLLMIERLRLLPATSCALKAGSVRLRPICTLLLSMATTV